MRKPKMEWSDEFDMDDADLDFYDDPEIAAFDLDEELIDDGPGALAAWQQIEERASARRLMADLADWDDWDGLMASH